MSLAAGRRVAHVGHSTFSDATLTAVLAAGLLVAACTHVTLAVQHGPSVFAVLTALAGAAQAALAVGALRGGAREIASPAMLLSMVLIQLYVLNVTTGLPPIIAHTHVPGTHELLAMTLAWPNTIDTQGMLAELAQAMAVTAAVLLRLRRS
jgi:hypothetical protein